MSGPSTSSPDLPAPPDDGAAAHLLGSRVPDLELPATDGSLVSLGRRPGLTVVYAYPRTGQPGTGPLTPDWDLIPGARGCTVEACSFRDHSSELRSLGAEVFGLSTQDTAYQQEVVTRLHLPFALLSDANLELAAAWKLPTFTIAGHTLLRRMTLALQAALVVQVWYPVFPPDRHAAEVVSWLRGIRGA